MKQVFIILVLCSFLVACNSKQENKPSVVNTIVIPTDTIIVPVSNASMKNGVLFFKDKPFSGVVLHYFDSTKQPQSVQSFFNGKEEGWLFTYYPNGNKESKRYFHLGEKDSVHTGWWDNGNNRFEYHFTKGQYNGLFKEWYRNSGNALTEIVYVNGVDVSGKSWRENGKLFTNFINKDGRHYGLQNSQPCYTVKDGQGQYFKKDSLQ
jgi:antitoxin component YwqK of YwqJK toxin-antitoxin module